MWSIDADYDGQTQDLLDQAYLASLPRSTDTRPGGRVSDHEFIDLLNHPPNGGFRANTPEKLLAASESNRKGKRGVFDDRTYLACCYLRQRRSEQLFRIVRVALKFQSSISHRDN